VAAAAGTPIGDRMTGTNLKITVLYDLWEEEPAEVPEEVPLPRARKGQKKRKKKPVKHDREEIFEALEKLGHEPSYYVLDGRPQTLLGLAKCGADLIFNLTESYAGDDTKEMHITAFLDILEIPYTGAGPHANILAQDKSIAKKMFAFHGIQSPYFATAYRGTIDHAHDISFPLIVKPTSEDGSIGIDAAAVVNSVKELMERVHYIQTEFDSPALIEEYIEGREIYAAVLGNSENAYTLPLVELDLSKLPKGLPRIATQDVKFDKDTEAYKLTKSVIAEDLDEETVTRLNEIAIKAYRAVRLRDYGRIDMRISAKGEVYVIEANPNPWLSSGQEFAMAARKSGLSYTQMIGEIVDLAMARHA
jgi:D-alanine-D-alanine ligase